MKDTRAFHQTRWCRNLEEQLLDCYSEIAKGMASTMSLQNPPGVSAPGIYLSRSWGSAPDPEVCLKGCRGDDADINVTPPQPPCTLLRGYRFRRTLKLKRKAATTDWELRHIPAGRRRRYRVMLPKSYRETIIKSQRLRSISASLIRSRPPWISSLIRYRY